MDKYVYILLCEGDMGTPYVFETPHVCDVGDVVLDGSLFTVLKVEFLNKSSTIYEILDDAVGIIPAQKIYRTVWEREENKEEEKNGESV